MILLSFLIYWLLFFVVHYIIVEYGQPYFYDETTPRFGLKVLAGSFLLALLAQWLKPGFDTMFTTAVHWTLLQAIAWFVVFTVLYQFHPPHALALGLASLVILPGLATMTIGSLAQSGRTLPPAVSPTGPHRGRIGGIRPTPTVPAVPPPRG